MACLVEASALMNGIAGDTSLIAAREIEEVIRQPPRQADAILADGHEVRLQQHGSRYTRRALSFTRNSRHCSSRRDAMVNRQNTLLNGGHGMWSLVINIGHTVTTRHEYRIHAMIVMLHVIDVRYHIKWLVNTLHCCLRLRHYHH